MNMSFTPRTLVSVCKNFVSIVGKSAMSLSIVCGSVFLTSCSVEEETMANLQTEPVKEIVAASKLYKGVFATGNSSFRGTISLTTSDFSEMQDKAAAGQGRLILHNGEVIELSSTVTKSSEKSSDFNIDFDSEDLSFSFFLDEVGNPQVTNVVYKKQEGAIIVAEETDKSHITPITGTYKCTNCENQDGSYEGIELNNIERTFNMLLTSRDGSTSVSIQAVLGSLIDAGFAVEENCATSGRFISCNLSDSDANELFTWSAIHRYATEADENGETCSGISGDIIFNTVDMGVIEAEFQSDGSCPINTYYVSSSGDDNNSGASPNDAWKSISKVNSVDFKPGDNVLFEGGNAFDGNLYFDSKDGNDSSNPVKISSYGTGKAKINAGNGKGIMVYNTAGFVIDNLIVAGSGMDANQESGIYFYNDLVGDVKLDFVEITNCEVYGFKEYGIVIGGYEGNSGFKNVLIENNKVYNILDTGISSYGKFSSTKTGYAHYNITVRGCEVFNIPGYAKGHHSGNPIMLGDVQHSMIEHSVAYNSGMGNASTSGGPVGIWYWDADDVIIQHCEAYNMSGGNTNKDGGGFDLDGGVTNGIMQYNYSHDNDGSGFLIGQFGGARPMHNITVRYNISENDAATNGGSIGLFNGLGTSAMKDIYVYNNTLYATRAAAINYISWKPITENINFHNNILYAANSAALIAVPQGYKGNFTGNLYYSTGTPKIIYQGTTYNSLESFRKTGNETVDNLAVGYEGDPLLFDAGNGGTVGFGNKLSALAAYKLQVGSPAIDFGIPLSLSTGNRDFYGNDLFQDAVPDIGAHGNLSENKSGELAIK